MAKDLDMMKPMVTMMGLVMMVGVLQMVLPTSAAPPVETPSGFGCPYGDGLFFDSMAELATHITEAHPDKPPFIEINIGWGQP